MNAPGSCDGNKGYAFALRRLMRRIKLAKGRFMTSSSAWVQGVRPWRGATGLIVVFAFAVLSGCSSGGATDGPGGSWLKGAEKGAQPGGKSGGEQGDPERDRPSPDKVPADAKAQVAGTAEDAKGGAVVHEADGRVVYIEGLDSWPEDLLGKAVTAEGRLVVKQYIPEATVAPDGAISQGAEGEQWVLENAMWGAASETPTAPAEPAGVPLEEPAKPPAEETASDAPPPAAPPQAKPAQN